MVFDALASFLLYNAQHGTFEFPQPFLLSNINAIQHPANHISMWAANETMKRPSDVEGETYSSKRQRVASVASQDSDENGQNPLGISFGEAEVAPFTSAPAESPDLEIADSQEDANDNEEGAKPASDKPSPDHISISSDDGKGAVVPPSLNDVKARLAARCFIFNIREIKIIVRWMRMHRTYKVTSHKAQFNELARYLGYTHPSLSQEDQAGLRSKLRVKMASFHINMKKSGGKSPLPLPVP